MTITSESVRAIFKGLETGAGAAFFQHVADDVDRTVMGTHPLAGRYLSKQAFREDTFAKLGKVLPRGAQLNVEHLFVHGDVAVVELHSLATPGVPPARLSLNHWALVGDWTVGKEAIALNQTSGRIAFRFHARDLNLVMGSPARGTPLRFRVSIDGQPPGAAHGADVDGPDNGTVVEQRLYQLIRQLDTMVDRQFEIEFLGPGAEAYDFTFG